MQAVQMEPLTVEDYRMMPEAGPRYQLVEGELFMAPAPNRFHQDISGNTYFLLRGYLEKHPIGKLYEAPFDVYLDGFNVHQPDIVFIARANYEILTDAGAEGAPDFIVEILSPTMAFLDKKAKRKVYARTGVELRQKFCYPRVGERVGEMIRCARTNCYRGGNGQKHESDDT